MMLQNPMCDQMVTVYRRVKDQIIRFVLEGCFYRYRDVVTEDRFERKFVLIGPGEEPLRAGDRVFDGIGPETVCWEEFLSVNVPGLSQVQYAEPYFFLGKLHHWEAGR